MAGSIRYASPPEEVVFLRRPNRFLAVVRPVSGGPARRVHVPNPGRMEELLVPGENRGYIVAAGRADRATSATLVSVRHDGALVSIDTLAANRVVGEALRSVGIVGLPRRGWRPEVAVGRHRFDFGRRDVRTGNLVHLVEVKSSNLKVGDLALFPDAPTERGTRHLRALAKLHGVGVRTDVLIAIQRGDVRAFSPNRALDPEFADAFDEARTAGVRIRAYRLRVRPTGLGWGRPVPIVDGPRENIFNRHGPNAGR